MRVKISKSPFHSTLNEPVSLHLRSPSELLKYLLGSRLLEPTAKNTTIDSLTPSGRTALLQWLERTGNIVGTPQSWDLSPAVYAKALDTLKNRNALKAVLSHDKPPTPVHTLVRAFKAAQAPFPLQCRASRVASLFVFFRSLSKKYNADRLLEEIPNFAKAQRVTQNPKFNVEEFSRFIKTRIKPK